MKIGCCGSVDDAAKLEAAGFQFLEVGVQQVLRAQEDDATWAATVPDVDKLALPIEAANGLVPGSLPIVGPGRDLGVLQGYMRRVAERAEKLGIKRLVFGSGGARKRPDGVDDATVMEHLADFCRVAGDAAGGHGITIVVEHLNRKETNTINTLAEELELIERVAHPHVQALVDSYHFGLENDPDESLLALGDRLRHVHVAEPVGRVQPGGHAAGSADAYDWEHFFCLLRKAGYRERVSFEGKWTGPVEEVGPQTVELIRKTWEAAGRCES